MDGVNYTWDNNGNLLNDGVNTYAYDSANRLISINGTESYTYSGLGGRLIQNGTEYTLDLNARLTQVLDDGESTYLYGNGRISQSSLQTEYFLGDALGSVRQLTNADAEITLAKSYAPYGDLLSSAGSGKSAFAYTGEQVDSSGLVFLRARYYSPGTGRFLTKDSWRGDYNRPLSLNHWNYVEGNPVNYTDPTGQCPTGWKRNSDGTCTFDLIEWLTGIPLGGIVITVPEAWEGIFCEDEAKVPQLERPTATPRPATQTPASGQITPTPQSGTPTPQPTKSGRDLTPDERVHLNRIMSFDVAGWIAAHPDAPREYGGWVNPKGDHARETLERIAMLTNSVNVLERAVASGNLNQTARQSAIDGIATGERKKAELLIWLTSGN